MPCFRCGARQTDPERGRSPWARGVRAEVQVLVCPSCQGEPDWSAELQRCAACGSPRLSRALGVTRCSACGHLEDSSATGRPAGGPRIGGLRDEVDAAIDRVLGDHAGG